MWWALAKLMLDKNGSPAWNRINNIMSIWNAGQSTYNSGKSLWNKFQPSTTNSTGE